VEHVIAKYGVSERLACRVLGQHRSTQRKIPKQSEDEAALTADIIALATQYGRYGYRRITALLRDAGWLVNTKRVERIWRREGLKVPQKQPKKDAFGSTTDPASGCGQSIPTTSGRMTSSRTAHMMGASSACSTSSTSSRASAWRSG
jgi:transposase InsO family protein